MIVFALVISVLGMAAALWVASPLAKSGSGARLPTFAAAALIALGALGIYLATGSPGLPGRSYAEVERHLAEADPETLTLDEQEERLRSIARREPDNPEALALLGRFLSRTDRHLEGVAMMERSLDIERSPRVLSDLGQALVALNDGSVTPEAERAFTAATEADPDLPEPAFFLGAAAYDAGERNEALERWGAIIERLPPGDRFRDTIANRAADLLSRPQGGPDGGDDAPFADASPEDSDAMIAGMVSGLEQRLDEGPDDFSGWLTLARVRANTGDPDAARAALDEARSRFSSEPGAEAIADALGAALRIEEGAP